MTAEQVAHIAMFGAAACYIVAATAYFIAGMTWMFLTMMLYAISVLTVWMAGTK